MKDKDRESKIREFDILEDETITAIEIQRIKDEEHSECYSDKITFTLDGGKKYRLENKQDCSEKAFVKNISGNIADILFNRITKTQKIKSESYGKNAMTNSEIFVICTEAACVQIQYFCVLPCDWEPESVDLVEVEP